MIVIDSIGLCVYISTFDVFNFQYAHLYLIHVGFVIDSIGLVYIYKYVRRFQYATDLDRDDLSK